MANYLVKDWMSTSPITIDRHTSLLDARKLMEENQIRRLLVVEDGRLIGIVTEGDLREAFPSPVSSLSMFERRHLLATITVEEIMRKDPIVVSPGARIEEAADLLFEHKIGGLPVTENDQVVGIITESDILRGLVRELNRRS